MADWTSVKDGLPEPNTEDVFAVVVETVFDAIHKVELCFATAYYFHDDVWDIQREKSRVCFGRVTHWMPLPALPKEGA